MVAISDTSTINSQPLARSLGVFSIALGSLEVLAPAWVSRRVGLGAEHSSTVRMCGIRELATGLAILQNPSAPQGMWARIAGDVIDLSIIAKAFGERGSDRRMLSGASLAVAGVTALDVMCTLGLSNGQLRKQRSAEPIRETIAINAPAEELYRFWRALHTLPSVMNYLDRVEVIDDKRSHWVAKPLGNVTLEWDAEVIADDPNRMLAWRSVAGSPVDTEGKVAFEPLSGDRGTSVSVEMRFDVPGHVGRFLSPVTKFVTDVAVRRDLRRLKQLMETGEITSTTGQPAGRRSGETWLDRFTHA